MRLPALSLGRLELRRFMRARLTRIAVVALVFLPLLYAGLYLWSFWDPYGRLSHVPVALVVDDRPAQAGDRTIHAGEDLAKELRRRKVFGWRTVDAAEAEDGVRSGRYYLSLTIPRDFSARIASPADADSPPQTAALQVHLNDANNYVIGTIAEAAFKEVSAAASASAVKNYFDDVFVSFGTLHGKLQEASDGAGRLAAGAGRAEDGAGTLHDGLGTASTGSQELARGLGMLSDGTGRLASGSAQVAGGTQRLADTVDRVSGRAVPLLRTYGPRIRRASLLVADGADLIARDADRLPARTGAALRQARQAYAELNAYLAVVHLPPKVESDLRASARRVVDVAQRVDTYVRTHTGELRRIAADARVLSTYARKVADEVPTLADRIQQARHDVDRLNSGAHQVASGAAKVDAGTRQAHAASLRLADGLAQLTSGAGRLQQGLGKITDGAGRLSTGLGDGARQIPDYGAAARDQRSDMMSEPVRLSSLHENKAPNYGTGFAPFFVPLSLWVGAMIVYMLLRPLNQRALAGTAPAWRVALAGWLPATLLGMLQAMTVLSVLRVALGLEARHWPLMIAFLCLTAGTFVAVVQWVNAKFGPVGKVLALVLLMLQLTSAAGTYPIEASPPFFQFIKPLLPMPWVVEALRHLISGGDLVPVWEACGVLAAFLVGALLLTTLAARQNRVWTLKRLHPVLRL